MKNKDKKQNKTLNLEQLQSMISYLRQTSYMLLCEACMSIL